MRAGMWTNWRSLRDGAFVVTFEFRPVARAVRHRADPDGLRLLLLPDAPLVSTPRRTAASPCAYSAAARGAPQARDPSHSRLYVHPVETTIGQVLFHLTVLCLGLRSATSTS